MQVATTAVELDGIVHHRGPNCSDSDSAVSSWLRSVFGINSERATDDKVRSGSAFARRPVSAAGERWMGARLRDSVPWLPLAVAASNRNQKSTYSTIPVLIW